MEPVTTLRRGVLHVPRCDDDLEGALPGVIDEILVLGELEAADEEPGFLSLAGLLPHRDPPRNMYYTPEALRRTGGRGRRGCAERAARCEPALRAIVRAVPAPPS